MLDFLSDIELLIGSIVFIVAVSKKPALRTEFVASLTCSHCSGALGKYDTFSWPYAMFPHFRATWNVWWIISVILYSGAKWGIQEVKSDLKSEGSE